MIENAKFEYTYDEYYTVDIILSAMSMTRYNMRIGRLPKDYHKTVTRPPQDPSPSSDKAVSK